MGHDDDSPSARHGDRLPDGCRGRGRSRGRSGHGGGGRRDRGGRRRRPGRRAPRGRRPRSRIKRIPRRRRSGRHGRGWGLGGRARWASIVWRSRAWWCRHREWWDGGTPGDLSVGRVEERPGDGAQADGEDDPRGDEKTSVHQSDLRRVVRRQPQESIKIGRADPATWCDVGVGSSLRLRCPRS